MDYNRILNNTLKDIKPSGIRKFFDIANEMKDVVSLSIGEPDFATPWHIRDIGIYSLEKSRTHYLPNSGLYELREEICRYMERRFSLSYEVNQTLVTVGGSEAIDLALRSVLNPGDEVIIPEPCFVCYDPICRMAGGVPVRLRTSVENGYTVTPEALSAALTNKTKVVILSYPNNPTGAIMTKAQLEAIAGLLRNRDILIIADEIYAELTYGDEKHCSVASIEGLYDNTLVVNGFSKAYAMTGWRLGFVCGNKDLIKMMTKLHQFAVMCAPTTSQYAAVEALRDGDNDIMMMREEYNDRRKVITDGLNSAGLSCFEPKGAFYVFPDIRSSGMTSEEFCVSLLKSKSVAIVPGSAFGESGEGFARVSYAASLDSISKALERIDAFMREIKG